PDVDPCVLQERLGVGLAVEHLPARPAVRVAVAGPPARVLGRLTVRTPVGRFDRGHRYRPFLVVFGGRGAPGFPCCVSPRRPIARALATHFAAALRLGAFIWSATAFVGAWSPLFQACW